MAERQREREGEGRREGEGEQGQGRRKGREGQLDHSDSSLASACPTVLP